MLFINKGVRIYPIIICENTRNGTYCIWTYTPEKPYEDMVGNIAVAFIEMTSDINDAYHYYVSDEFYFDESNFIPLNLIDQESNEYLAWYRKGNYEVVKLEYRADTKVNTNFPVYYGFIVSFQNIDDTKEII
jgi:hypothetical protein